MDPIKPVKIVKGMKVSDLVNSFSDCGFNANKISKAVEILKEAKKEDCRLFFGFAGAMVPAGMKQIVVDMINDNTINVLVTTGANITHDLIEALGNKHYKGNANINDAELHKQGIDRIYDVFMKSDVYKDLEGFFEKNFDILKDKKTIKEFLWEIGKLVNKDDCILTACYKKKIPVFCPALSDSGIGLMIWNNLVKNKKISFNEFEDLKEILDIAWTEKKKMVFYIGGGVPKNYIQQAMQFSSPALYGIQITIDDASFGGSSGAPLKEGISWGKMNEKGKFVNVNCDATIALPLIYAGYKN
ncbi:deoxyhypusine synthase family protein [Candidatus Woesearchaeota archaeon]|nr:deoxyhypusine synthase family protein [Candidatus Woesearchaeota archaeon]